MGSLESSPTARDPSEPPAAQRQSSGSPSPGPDSCRTTPRSCCQTRRERQRPGSSGSTSWLLQPGPRWETKDARAPALPVSPTGEDALTRLLLGRWWKNDGQAMPSEEEGTGKPGRAGREARHTWMRCARDALRDGFSGKAASLAFFPAARRRPQPCPERESSRSRAGSSRPAGPFVRREPTDGHLLGEGQGDEEQRQPHGDAGDDLVERQLQPQPLEARLRRLLQQEVGEDVLGGDVRDGHGEHGSARLSSARLGCAGPRWAGLPPAKLGWARSGTPPQPGPAPPGEGRGAAACRSGEGLRRSVSA